MTAPRALGAVEVVTRLSALPGWRLSGDGDEVAIEKAFTFGNFHQTLAFVNAVAWIAHTMDHHPELAVHYGRCVVRWRTHDAQGITDTDFTAASRVDELAA